MFNGREEHLAALPLGDQLQDYIDNGYKYEFGDFLTAIIENNLGAAAVKADHINFPLLGIYGAYMYEYAPAGCRGDKDVRKAWRGRNVYLKGGTNE